MATPTRHSNSKQIVRPSRTFFVTTKTSMGRALLQSEGNAMLFIEVLRSYVAAKKFKVHDFVVMPDHVHLLLTVGGEMSIEKAVQFIKEASRIG
jgi:putative transposase